MVHPFSWPFLATILIVLFFTDPTCLLTSSHLNMASCAKAKSYQTTQPYPNSAGITSTSLLLLHFTYH